MKATFVLLVDVEHEAACAGQLDPMARVLAADLAHRVTAAGVAVGDVAHVVLPMSGAVLVRLIEATRRGLTDG